MLSTLDDTICAPITPPGTGAVGVFRISGTRAFSVADAVLSHKQSCAKSRTHTIHRAKVKSADGEIVDDALVSVFRAPHSYTGEDAVEISCHGGSIPMGRTLAAILEAGARMAHPGEFTFRAFMNGKLDLAQAESVADMIAAKTTQAHRTAMEQHSGRLSKEIGKIRDAILFVLAQIEASIDFPEDVGELSFERCKAQLLNARAMIDALLASADRGILQREGAKIVIAGRPNAGKSSLMNALLGDERAIVTPIPGTTRDLVEETLNIGGIPVRLIDTAGIRETSDLIEKIGVERSQKSVQNADLVLVVVDASRDLEDADNEFQALASKSPHLLIANKIDIASPSQRAGLADFIAVSALTGEGLEALETRIAGKLLGDASNDERAPVIAHSRQKNAIIGAKTSVENALSTIEKGLPADFLAIDARGAISSLDEITGITTADDVINEIFSKFCIGK